MSHWSKILVTLTISNSTTRNLTLLLIHMVSHHWALFQTYCLWSNPWWALNSFLWSLSSSLLLPLCCISSLCIDNSNNLYDMFVIARHCGSASSRFQLCRVHRDTNTGVIWLQQWESSTLVGSCAAVDITMQIHYKKERHICAGSFAWLIIKVYFKVLLSYTKATPGFKTLCMLRFPVDL